ncbi:MAG: hypothetical protein WD960_05475 [Gemmatimonadota bacterium]
MGSTDHATLHGLAVCSRCGYRGQGITYFSRTTHAALLTVAALLTYGLGGLLYWVLKREARVCPSCGAPWPGSRPLSHPTAADRGAGSGSLPRSGLIRRVGGALIGLVAVFLISLGFVFGDPVLLASSLVAALTGALGFGWGLNARRSRREALLHRTQRQVLELAASSGGRLTATEVATGLDLSLEGAERVLFSLEDGFRVRSDVTPDGILFFEFRELLIPGGGGGSGILEGPGPG